MFEDGQTVNKIVKTTKLDREWLIKKLPTKPRRRSKVSAEAVRRSRKKAAG